VLLHEVDHFNKRNAFSGQEISKAKTPRTKNNIFANKPEGGFYFIKTLFSVDIRRLSLEQAEFILNLNNWNCSLNEFQAKFSDIVNIKDDAPSIRLINTSENEDTYCYIAMNRMQEPENTCSK
jgi:hypothetical protein